jgi:hypothetical protein
MYSKRAGLILGFHGCDQSIRDAVVGKEGELLKPSENDYDWLGSGIYFWENSYERALQYAVDLKNDPISSKIKIVNPSVIGAVLDLGHCLDFLDSEYLNLLKAGYEMLCSVNKKHGLEIPENKSIEDQGDLLLRRLDCGVIETIHQFNEDEDREEFDSVRGVFFEGKNLYPNAGFKEKNHIQIAIRNTNCIKGFFVPRTLDSRFPKP